MGNVGVQIVVQQCHNLFTNYKKKSISLVHRSLDHFFFGAFITRMPSEEKDDDMRSRST